MSLSFPGVVDDWAAWLRDEDDAETGFYHYRSRYLDPATGRFTTRDTIGLWGDAANRGNPYTYANNNLRGAEL